jgi:hypothetical protein
VGVEPFSPGLGAVREDFGIDLEISSPIGFLRLMDDFGAPKEDPEGVEAFESEATEGESREMGFGCAANRDEATGGCSDIVVRWGMWTDSSECFRCTE